MQSIDSNATTTNNSALFHSVDDESRELDFDELFFDAFHNTSTTSITSDELNSSVHSNELDLHIDPLVPLLGDDTTPSLHLSSLHEPDYDGDIIPFGIASPNMSPSPSLFSSINKAAPDILQFPLHNNDNLAKVEMPSPNTLHELRLVLDSLNASTKSSVKPAIGNFNSKFDFSNLTTIPNPAIGAQTTTIPHQKHNNTSNTTNFNNSNYNYELSLVPSNVNDAFKSSFLPRTSHLSVDTSVGHKALLNFMKPRSPAQFPTSTPRSSTPSTTTSNTTTASYATPTSATASQPTTSTTPTTAATIHKQIVTTPIHQQQIVATPLTSATPSPTARRQKTQNFKCPLEGCNQTFHKQMNLASHLKTHNSAKIYKCASCETTFRRSHDLRRHIASLHSEEGRAFACLKCPKRFARLDALKRHVSRRGNKCFVDLGGEGAMQKLATLVEDVKRAKGETGMMMMMMIPRLSVSLGSEEAGEDEEGLNHGDSMDTLDLPEELFEPSVASMIHL